MTDIPAGSLVNVDWAKLAGGHTLPKKGIVVGIATNGVAVLGKSYIIKDLSKTLPTKEYPYEYYICSENFLSPATFEEEDDGYCEHCNDPNPKYERVQHYKNHESVVLLFCNEECADDYFAVR